MKDGAVIQIGTPEELVLNPATEYVAEFTKEIPRAKVLSAGAIMAPLDGTNTASGQVPASAKVEELAEDLVDSDTDVTVTDEAGKAIGRLSRRAVLDVLVGRNQRS